MTVFYKVLGQTNPVINTSIDLYTAQPNTSTLVSTIVICNQSVTASAFTIAIRPAGITANVKHYLNSNTAISANDTIALTIGITLATTDVITVSAGSNSLSFTAFGAEIGTLTGTVLPTINTVQVTDNSYTATGSETLSTSGGYIKLTGSNFASNAVTYIDGVVATSTTYVNTSEVRARVPAKSAGSYPLMLFNGTSPGIIYPAGVRYAAAVASVITWLYQPGRICNTTSGTTLLVGPLATVNTGSISFAITSGALPAGLTLDTGTGILSGSLSSTGTFNFTVTATVASYSDSRAYSIVVTTQIVVNNPPAIDLLIVAGGGGGGASTSNNGGAGGGAGGYRSFTAQAVGAGTYTITVAAGASAGRGARNSGAADSENGAASSAFGFTSAGGGRGGSDTGSQTGGDGGSGGGAGGSGTTSIGAGNTPPTTPSQGNSGGQGGTGGGGNQGPGGGGGAGGVGQNRSGGTAGAGGAGSTWLNGSTYAGGGGGGASNGGGGAAGGTGGGGTGAQVGTLTAGSGDPGTGGGGGGAAQNYSSNTNIGGNGGSGVVIIRYANTYSDLTTTGGPAYANTGGYKYYTWTSSGSVTF